MKSRNFDFLISKLLFICSVICISLVSSFTVKGTDDSFKLDFDGDGKSDIGIYREGERTFVRQPSYWYILNSSTGQSTTTQWGSSFDYAVPSDYDNDGLADIAIFRSWEYDDQYIPIATNNLWVLQRSGGYYLTPFFGGSDIKYSRDYINDGKAEAGRLEPVDLDEDPTDFIFCIVYRFVIQNGDSFVLKYVGNICNEEDTYFFSQAVGDYDNNGKSDIAVFKRNAAQPSDSHFEVWLNVVPDFYTAPNITQNLDIDLAVPGDYDGDGTTDFAGYKKVNGSLIWRIRKSSSGTVTETQFGVVGDKPVSSDYDGDGKTDIAIFRPSTGTWWILRSSDGVATATAYGLSTDVPLQMTNPFSY